MHCLLLSILFLLISSNTLTCGLIDIQNIYRDLEKLNKTCSFDECSYRAGYPHYACDCDVNCIQFDICCLESPYIGTARHKVKSTCKSVYNGGAHFMIDSCPPSDTVWDGLCRDEWNGEDDIMKLVPVTSPLTSATYKNYFCFRCNEANDKFFYWKINLQSKDSQYNMSDMKIISDEEKQLFVLSYDSDNEEWIVSLRNNSVRIPVKLLLEIPDEISPFVKICDTSIKSNCSNEWNDTDISEKCDAYKAIRVVQRDGKTFRYKNMHCALCNFEDLNDITCLKLGYRRPGGGGYHGGGGRGSYGPKKTFTFAYLLDVNNSDGDRVGEIRKCDDDHIWDPFAKTCRKLTCALPRYKVKNRKCEPE